MDYRAGGGLFLFRKILHLKRRRRIAGGDYFIYKHKGHHPNSFK